MIVPTNNVISSQIDVIKTRGMEYKSRNKLISSDRQSTILFQSMADFDQDLTKLRSERISRESFVRVMREEISEGNTVSIPSTLNASESRSRIEYINEMKTKLMEYQIEKEQLSMKYRDKHPKMQELLTSISEIEVMIKKESKEILNEEDSGIKAIRSSEQAIAQRMSQVANSIAKLSKQEYELGKLTIGVTDLEAVLSMLIRQKEEAFIAGKKNEYLVRVQLLEPAMIPDNASWPNRPLIIGLGFIFALFVAFGSAFFLEYFDHSVNTAEDVQHCLGLPLLAIIPDAESVKTNPPAVAKTGQKKPY